MQQRIFISISSCMQPRKRKSKPSAKNSKSKVGRKSKRNVSVVREPPDILSKAAMHNVYFIAHGPMQFLSLRGFTWPGAPQIRKKKRRK